MLQESVARILVSRSQTALSFGWIPARQGLPVRSTTSLCSWRIRARLPYGWHTGPLVQETCASPYLCCAEHCSTHMHVHVMPSVAEYVMTRTPACNLRCELTHRAFVQFFESVGVWRKTRRSSEGDEAEQAERLALGRGPTVHDQVREDVCNILGCFQQCTCT
jgi:hypothetical protein